MLPLAIFISFGFLLFHSSALRRLLLPFLSLYAVHYRNAAVVVGSTESGKQKSQTPATRALPALHLFQDPLHNSSCSVPEILKSDMALALARRHVSHSHSTFELHVTERRRCGPSVPGALEKDAKSLM